MGLKALRHSKILEIVRTQQIETQEDFAAALREMHIEATQATISRDIKELRLQKTLTKNGTYKYSLPNASDEVNLDSRLHAIFKECAISVECAMNIVVVRTLPGLANGACAAVDAMKLDYVLGTLAGDDTGMIVVRDGAYAETLRSRISRLMR